MKPVTAYATSEKETAKIALIFAKNIREKMQGRRNAYVAGLTGILGAGKTTFIRYFAKALGIREKILSPSFLIFKKYPIPKRRKGAGSQYYLVHVDCYRLKKPGELLALDFKKELINPKNFIVIEWAEKIKKILPKKMIWISINLDEHHHRIFKFTDHPHQ